jgi:FkbM family methyltransferase
MRAIITRAFRIGKVLAGKDFYQRRQARRKRITMGNRFADWTICPDGINSESIVYSFGVGEDISWDLQMIEMYGMKINAFDPSPGSVRWLAEQALPEELIFHPFGLAAEDGEITFAEPEDPGSRSLRITDQKENRDWIKIHHLPVHKLDTIKSMLGHDHIDILKMDIEGAEYMVVDDIAKSSSNVDQLLVEFHHRFRNIGIDATRKSISKLNRAGFRIFHVSSNGEEFSFIRG